MRQEFIANLKGITFVVSVLLVCAGSAIVVAVLIVAYGAWALPSIALPVIVFAAGLTLLERYMI